MYLLADYLRYELVVIAKSTIRKIGHPNKYCKIGRVRILHCGKHRPEDDEVI